MNLMECKYETFDLDTDEGAYWYLTNFLKDHAASTRVFSCASRLYTSTSEKEHIIKAREIILKLEEDKKALRQAVRVAWEELQQWTLTENDEHTILVKQLCRKVLQDT